MLARPSKVVIPVAGLGTRSLPFTKEVPKELLPIVDTPAVHHIVEEVLAAQIETVVLVTGRGKSALEDYFDLSPGLMATLEKRGKGDLVAQLEKVGRMVDLVTVRQKEALGLGHAVLCARPVLGKEPFAVCLGDEVFPAWGIPKGEEPELKKLVEVASRTGHSTIGVMQVSLEDTRNYGVIDIGSHQLDVRSRDGELVRGTVEKPNPKDAPSRYAVIGRYVFDNEILDCLAKVKPGRGGEIQLTDGMDMLARSGKLRAVLMAGTRYDMGNHLQAIVAQVDAGLQRPELRERLKIELHSLLQRH